jgi:hypothetical protein
MISSTALDLPDHRKQAVEACQRAGVFPIPMEHLAARDVPPVDVCMEMVDQADIYIGIYGWRYPLLQADGRNVLAQLECDLGHRDAAIEAATAAYRLAWCDGPPYAYHSGLTIARQHLKELGAPEPQLAPFDERKFSPMPDVELNPKDDFWVNPDKLDSQSCMRVK